MLHNPNWKSPVIDCEMTCLLNRAADALERYGHAKSVLRNVDGNMCLVGAIMYAQGIVPTYNNEYRRTLLTDRALEMVARVPEVVKVMGYYNQRYSHPGICMSVVGWNDLPETRSYEVIGALRQAAIMAQNES